LEPGELGFRIKITLSDPLLCLAGSRSNSIKNVDANNWNQEQQDLERTRAAIRRETENLFNEIHDQVLSSFPTPKLYGADSRKGNNILALANADFFSSSIALPRRNAVGAPPTSSNILGNHYPSKCCELQCLWMLLQHPTQVRRWLASR
jgi:hypothetical protein